MLEIVTLECCDRWDTIVRTFERYDVYWLSGYVKAFQIHGDGTPLLFYYEDKRCRGINVVMKRDISDDVRFEDILPRNTFFDFSTPYGYGGWIIEGNENEKLYEEYQKWCVKHSIISEFVRFHPVLRNHSCNDNYYEIVQLGNTITLDLSSPEIIWENITSKNRNMIRKAKKNGIKIYNGRYPEIYDVFRKVYNKTMDKDNADQYYYFKPEFYESICNDLPYNIQVFYAVLGEQIIAASIVTGTKGMMNYHLSGSLKEYSCYAPTNLLLYEVARWGYENGYKSFYLGGGVGSGEDSLFKFKKSFYRKDDLKKYYIGKKVYDQQKYENLSSIRTDINRESFFPKYRG